MFIVGLTGGIATGKSTVSHMIRELGVPVIDADVIARKVVEPGTPGWREIKKVFGNSVLLPTGEINRQTLGDIIFSNSEKRRLLNEITHPRIHRLMMWDAFTKFLQGYQFVVIDTPLLFESGAMLSYIHKIIVVTCEEDLQLQRLIERNSMPESRAKQRIKAQMPLEEKCNRANFVIENSGSLTDTKDQVGRIVATLKASRFHWKIRVLAGLICSGFLSLLYFLSVKSFVFFSGNSME
nr:PREDICTED: dephospho-CoA kinase domain-containing protein [Bemisia tabaci]